MPSIREPRVPTIDGSLARHASKNTELLRVHHAQPRVEFPVTKKAADRGTGSARPGSDDHPVGNRMFLVFELSEDRFGDVVVSAPIRRALGVGELVHVVTVQLTREPMRFRVDRRRIAHEMTTSPLRLDQRDLGGTRARGHHRDKIQAQQLREIRLADSRRSGRRFDDSGLFGNPAVADRVEEKRPCESMLETPRDVGRLVFR